MANPALVRHSELINQLILDRTTMEELGRVEVLWMYVPAHKVLGFIGKSGFLGSNKSAFNLTQLDTIGTNLLVNSKPQETDAEKVRQLESLINCEVWTDTGTRIGKIVDYEFVVKTGDIRQYMVAFTGWSTVTDGIYALPPNQILSLGRKRVVLHDTVARSLPVYREGIKQKIRHVEDVLKKDYQNVTQEFRSLTQRAQSAAEQARERARLLAEQAREQARLLNEQLLEGTATIAEQARERSQSFVEQMKEQAEILRDQLADEPDVEPTADIPDSIFEEDWDIETPPQPATSTPPPTPPPTPTAAPIDEWDDGFRSKSDWVPPTAEPADSEAVPTRLAEVVEDWEDDDPWDLETPPAPALSIAQATINIEATEVDPPEPAAPKEPAAEGQSSARQAPAEQGAAGLPTEPAATEPPLQPEPTSITDDDEPWI